MSHVNSDRKKNTKRTHYVNENTGSDFHRSHNAGYGSTPTLIPEGMLADR
jgi:hypothetical protein